MDRLGELGDLLEIGIPLGIRNQIHDDEVDGNTIRRSVIDPYGAPSNGAKNFPIRIRTGMGAGPPPADSRVVKVLACQSLLIDSLVTDLGNRLKECTQELQGVVLDVVGKFDKTAFLECVE